MRINEVVNEKITKDTPMGDVIRDFYASDAPQFKGKSKKKRRQMAIAAKLSMESIMEDLDPKTEIYVDMDGVLADFFGVWNKMMGVKHWKEIKNIEAGLAKIRNQKDFWINLPMTRNAKRLLSAIKKHKGKYNILSSPLAGDPNAEPQKREWVQKYLGGFAPTKVIIDDNKAQYATQPDGTPNILIDDFGQNISKWNAAGGIGIQHKDIEINNTINQLDKVADEKEPVIAEKTLSPAQWQKAMIKKYGEDGWYDIIDAVRDYYESNAILDNTISDIIKIKNDHPSFTDYSGITKLYRYERKDKSGAPTDDTFIPFAYNIKGAKNFVQSMAQGNMGFKKGDFELVEKDFNPGDAILNFTNLIELVHNAEDDDGEWYKREYEVWMKRTPYYTGEVSENFADGKKKGKDLDSLRKFVRSQREAPDQVLYQMMMAPDTYGHSASNFVRSWYEKTKEENGLNDVDSALEIMVDELGLNENFADGKKKGKSRPGRVKRAGASCNGSVTELRRKAKKYSGERGKMYHWCANMKAGKKK